MTDKVAWILLASFAGIQAFGQTVADPSSDQVPAPGRLLLGNSAGNTSGNPVKFQGLLARSDGVTLSLQLSDERVIRFQLDARTTYTGGQAAPGLRGFHIADVVAVEAEAEAQGNLRARTVRFIRKPSANEQANVLQCPELNYRVEQNVIGNADVDEEHDSRKLSLMAKPTPLFDSGRSKQSAAGGDELIASIRAQVNEAWERLPNLRAHQITSTYRSNGKNPKWIPNAVISSEVAYEGDREIYSEVEVDGKRPANAPLAADADYMRSFNNAWSTGDFETLTHCVFAGLEDADFHRVASRDDFVVYEFAGGRASTCIAVRSQSQIAYPAYRGSFKVNPQTQEVTHVELEATGMPKAFPLDRAERSVDFDTIEIANEKFLLPKTGYWFGCYRNSYACFLNRVDFRDYRRFGSDSTVRFASGN